MDDSVILDLYWARSESAIRFFVEMPTMEQKNGLKTFGAFYVPAVQSEFLENMPLWDGRFN